MASTFSTETSGGLVEMACLPACRAWMQRSACVPLGVKTPTTSTSSRAISSSKLPAAAQPHSWASLPACSGRRS